MESLIMSHAHSDILHRRWSLIFRQLFVFSAVLARRIVLYDFDCSTNMKKRKRGHSSISVLYAYSRASTHQISTQTTKRERNIGGEKVHTSTQKQSQCSRLVVALACPAPVHQTINSRVSTVLQPIIVYAPHLRIQFFHTAILRKAIYWYTPSSLPSHCCHISTRVISI